MLWDQLCGRNSLQALRTPQTLTPPPARSLPELDLAQDHRDSRLSWPYLFPDEQDLLREYLGEALWREERERLEPGEDLPVLV